MQPGPYTIPGLYAPLFLIIVILVGTALIAAATWSRHRPVKPLATPAAWRQYRFGYTVYALIFLSFDMEMIFMYPWAVVFAKEGLMAFLDMMVFIALLSAGIAYAWGQGGLKWE